MPNDNVVSIPIHPTTQRLKEALTKVLEIIEPLSPLEALDLAASIAAMVNDAINPGPIDSTIEIVKALMKQASLRARHEQGD
jgi:hypothetical protein